MPITFAQPDPMGFETGAAQAGGFVQQYNADRQFALQSAALRQQGMNEQAQRQMQQQAMQNQAAQQAAVISAQGRVTPAMNYQADVQTQEQANQIQAQQEMQAQHFQQQQQLLSQQEAAAPETFTQADSTRLAQLQAQSSTNDGYLADGSLSQGLYNQYQQGIQKQMQPLLDKQQRAGVARQRQVAANMLHATAQQTAIGLKNAVAFAAQAGTKDGTNNIYNVPGDPKSGVAAIVGPDLRVTRVGGAGKAAAASETAGLKPFDHNASWHGAVEASKNKETGQVDLQQAQKIHEAGLANWKKDNQAALEMQDFNQKVKSGLLNPDGTQTLQGVAADQKQAAAIFKQAGNDPQQAIDLVQKTIPKPSPEMTRQVGAWRFQVEAAKPPAKEEPVIPAGTDAEGYTPPEGYKTDADAPGYIVPSHWQRGQHYTVQDGQPVKYESVRGLVPKTVQEVKDEYNQFRSGLGVVKQKSTEVLSPAAEWLRRSLFGGE